MQRFWLVMAVMAMFGCGKESDYGLPNLRHEILTFKEAQALYDYGGYPLYYSNVADPRIFVTVTINGRECSFVAVNQDELDTAKLLEIKQRLEQ